MKTSVSASCLNRLVSGRLKSACAVISDFIQKNIFVNICTCRQLDDVIIVQLVHIHTSMDAGLEASLCVLQWNKMHLDIIYKNPTLHGLTLETSTVGSSLMEMEKDPIVNISTYK